METTTYKQWNSAKGIWITKIWEVKKSEFEKTGQRLKTPYKPKAKA